MNVVVIGSGISATIVAKTFLESNHKVYLVDSGNILDNPKLSSKNKYKFLPDVKKSPKFNDKFLINSVRQFKKKYKIKTKNFLLASGLISGGLSNFWGGGLEIPKSSYLKKYFFGNSILNERTYIDRELQIDKKRFSFFNYFYNQKIIKKILKKTNKNIYFSKFLLALQHYNTKKLNIQDYDKIDLLTGCNQNIYNSKFQILNLLKNNNFIYLPNTFVENIKKSRSRYLIISDNKNLSKINFDKLIISTGTVGSTILVDRIFNYSGEYRLFHTPILKLMYFSFSLPFKIKNKIKFSLPLLKLNIHIKKEKFSGSFMQLNNISNNFFGIRKSNILFSLFKKFIFVGNIFLPYNYSNTYIKVDKNRTLIYSNDNFNKKQLILSIKKKLNLYLSSLNLIEFFYQNLKFLQNGSDAHYSSTLINKHIKGKKILNDLCELNSFKNIHVIDGSSIKEGLHFPTYFLMMYSRFISKLIINNEKKNKN